ADALAGMGLATPPEEIHLERPQRLEHGDFSTNVALAMAKAAGRPPRQIAEELAERLRAGATGSEHPASVEAAATRPEHPASVEAGAKRSEHPASVGAEATSPGHITAVEVAGPGFVNFRLHPGWLHEVLSQVLDGGEEGYARPDLGAGEKVQIEFVSANPTGPVHVGNGWFGSYGDALARIMRRCGWEVSTEYYVNDTGGQIARLGESLVARRRREEVAEGGYQGEYVAQLAARYDGSDDPAEAGRWAADIILADIKETLSSMGIVFDEWFSQAEIEESGRVADTIGELRARGHVFDADGAVWLRTTAFGDSRDRVLVKSNGESTYLAGDLAYHRNKFVERGFGRVVDVLGADHYGQVASLEAGMEALGVRRDRLEVRIGQLISLVGRRMSKRSGHYVALSTLIDTLGADATRLLSLMTSIDQATTLDLDLVTRQSMENPVYYVQYAHARIASIQRVASERGLLRKPPLFANLSLLTHPRELDLLRRLFDLPTAVTEAATDRAPYKVTNWARALAGDFHGFYHDCLVMGEGIEAETTQARLALVEGVRIGLAIGLGLLGVHAPDQM
ncbi:MAG: arginine--tRNA ligase, partial [Acidimicrobiales bacterium]